MVDTTLMTEINVPQALTREEQEGVRKYEERMERRREYNRIYMANKRKTDPEFAQKQRDMTNRRKNERYATDEAYRAKELEYNRRYNQEKKADKYKLLYESKKASENTA